MKRTVKTTQPTAPAKRELMPIQQLIADEVSDMLLHGGHSGDIESLLFAALGHYYFRMFLATAGRSGQWEDAECRESAETCVIKSLPTWKNKLTSAWVENLRTTPKPTPIDVVGRIRAGVMDDLRDAFGEFLSQGSPEDHRLLLLILQRVNESSLRDREGTVALATVFAEQLGTTAYIQVPERIREEVEQYANSLLSHSETA